MLITDTHTHISRQLCPLRCPALLNPLPTPTPAVQDGVDRSRLGPACAGSLLTATDAGLAGRACRAMPGLSSTVGILSSAATSALLHPEDAGCASYNINLCGQDKVGGGRGLC